MRRSGSDARHGRRSYRGFTLQEMVVALCVSTLLVGGSIKIWGAIRRNTLTAAANEMLAQLALARSDAVRRHVRVTVCPSRDHRNCLESDGDFTFWQDGWLTYVDANGNARPDDGEITRGQTAAPDGIVIRSARARSRVSYQPSGTSAGSAVTIAVCDKDDPTLARYIIVSNGGRARVARTTTSSVKCGPPS